MPRSCANDAGYEAKFERHKLAAAVRAIHVINKIDLISSGRTFATAPAIQSPNRDSASRMPSSAHEW